MLPTVTRAIASLLALVVALVLVGSAQATTVVPVDDADLIDHADSIVLARVGAIRSHWDPARRQIFTDITLALEEVLAGPPLPTTLTIRQPGGRVGGLEARIDGAPEFQPAERAVLFLRVAPDGTLRVAHLHQGKFRVTVEPQSGAEIAVRRAGPGVRVLRPRRPGPPPADTRPLEELRRTIRAREGRRPARLFLGVTSPAPPTAGLVQEADAFTFLGEPARWFEPDSGQAIAMSISSNGEPAAPTRGFDQARAALGAWRDPGSAFRFGEGPLRTAAGNRFDGANLLSFGDPLGQIDPPVNCSGTLAQGGYFRSTSETRVVGGRSYWRILEGDIVIANGWQGCGFYEVFANLAEVATHELGHVLGFGHSSDPDATMFGIAHFDGRGSSLRADDRVALRTVYPASPSLTVALTGTGRGTVTSSPGGITCPTDCAQPFTAGTTVRLSAAPATGSRFVGWSGGGCSGTAACTVAVSAALSLTARFDTTSALALVFTAPRSGATVAGRTTVTLAASGGSGYSYQVRLDGAVIFAGTTPSFAWDTTTVANGGHTLAATVRDSLGRTASASVPVTVSNTSAGAAGSLRVAITQPRSGATVSGIAWAVLWVEGTTGTSNTFTLSLGGRVVGTTTTSSRGPVSMAYDTRTVTSGTQPLTATVRDAGGAAGTATVSVVVSNGGAPAPPPPSPPPPSTGTLRVFLTSPPASSTVSGVVWVNIWVEGATGTSNVYTLTVNGVTVATQTSGGRHVTPAWDSRATPNGTRTVTATVRDAAGNTGSTSLTVTVSN
jgi:hypothetical protein